MVWIHSNGVCTTVRYHTKTCKRWQINCVFRPSVGLSTQIMEFEYKQAYTRIETGVLVWKSKIMKPYQSIFFTLVAICLKLNDEIMCLTASPKLIVKQCQDYMQKGGRKVETAGSTRYHITIWNKSGSDGSCWYIDGLINLMTRTPKSKLFNIALAKYTLS